MGDHLELLVNRLLTEQTLAATIQSINQAKTEHDLSPMADLEGGFSPEKKENNESQRLSTGKLVECRICQDEDEDTNMETPCSCSGSLKYAHRKCIQKWCNEKGDTVCEICLQHFKPGYTAPPKLFRYGNIPENFRGNWEVSTHEINNHQFITMIQRDDDLLDSENNDDSVSTSRGLFYCRLVAAIALALLFLRHVLAIIHTEVEQYSFTLVTMLALKTVAFFLPLYVMLGKVIAFPRRHLLLGTQESPTDTAASEEENENTQTTQPRIHVIQIR